MVGSALVQLTEELRGSERGSDLDVVAQLVNFSARMTAPPLPGAALSWDRTQGLLTAESADGGKQEGKERVSRAGRSWSSCLVSDSGAELWV